jgi:hypothetical protein
LYHAVKKWFLTAPLMIRPPKFFILTHGCYNLEFDFYSKIIFLRDK